MAITPEQAYRPVLGEKPEDMDDDGLIMSEFKLRSRNPKFMPEDKAKEVLQALDMVRNQMEKRKLKPFGSK